MTNRLRGICAIIVMCATCAHAQVTVNTKIDHTQILIGQQTNITLEVSADCGQSVEMPTYEPWQELLPGIEVAKTGDCDTTWLNDRKRMLLTRLYTVTSFDSALYYIPPFSVTVDGEAFTAEQPLALKVMTMEIDTTNVDAIFPLKGTMDLPYEADEWKLPMRYAFLLAVLALLLVYVVVSLKDNKPIIRRLRLKARIAPHKLAMQKIEQLKVERNRTQPEHATTTADAVATKDYYTQLTDALRQYINERYGFNATEMTTQEIIANLRSLNSEEALNELRELFETADLVKFAKYSTEMTEDDRNLVNAIAFINSTKQDDVPEQAPQEVTVVEQGSPTMRTTLTIVAAVLSVAAIALIGYVGYRLVFLLM